MRKKFREISVDGVRFAWSVKASRYGVTLNIWDNTKNLIHQKYYRYKGEFFDFESLEHKTGITPGMVTDFIRENLIKKTSA